MKILLVYPYFLEKRIHEDDINALPIGLFYVGALLKNRGYEVEILDWHTANRDPGLIEKVLSEKRPDVLGFSVLQANRWGAVEIARVAKKVNPRTAIIFGGVSPTFLWNHFLTHFPEVDFVVLGEGERPFLRLVRWVEKGGNEKDLETIEGIAYRRGKRITRNRPGPFLENPDDLPDPAQYFTFQHVVSSRGCPWECVFCGSPRFWERRVRFHSVNYFVNQLQTLSRKGVSFFYVSDDTFTLKKERVINICKEIIRRKLPITWVAISRVGDVDDEILSWMRKAGCVQVSYGVESGSENIRNFLNKKIRTSDIEKAFTCTTRMGIMARAYFIYGNRGESSETIQETIDLMLKIKPLSVIFYILDIFPGTALYENYKRASGATDDIWLGKIEDIMYFETDEGLTREQILAYGKTLRETFYKALPRFVDSIQLAEREDLFPFHADFCSRLAMTFTHGDYAHTKGIRGKDRLAENLYRKALHYYPDHRAYLGLGILYQKQRAYEASLRILLEGIDHFSESEQLHLCLGISYMNLGRMREALSSFEHCKDTPEAQQFISACKQALKT
ncbi:MAG: B12-binding domain-containing radical SAM protein [Deltaproteobacteria bacterium]|nr:MAG: B12-binding domain-containing radical SAM protein [Desulfobacteraceae bacterium 4484_190.3]RLB14150.1 MAG: B12-binding domain-containing radical SAM protein [Deltaproteobacteria bacterium]